MSAPDLVASFFTLSGAGFGEPPRNGFEQRCAAAAAAGFAGIGMHAADLPRARWRPASPCRKCTTS